MSTKYFTPSHDHPPDDARCFAASERPTLFAPINGLCLQHDEVLQFNPATGDTADWQPYNPNAERDARIEAEGPIHQPDSSVDQVR